MAPVFIIIPATSHRDDTPPYRFTIELPDDGTLNKILFRGLRSTAGGSQVNIQLSGPNSPATASKKILVLISKMLSLERL